ncbi:SH3 and multiple ankyrin repeat domains protein 1 [Aplysia californica]|uniref:SH3 and multiple ankyrin repeat domains protein 1 n=1 Tax=Aplysia californica TaxID=6500 RepID=A0ABM1AEZ3_APLCA|nr:SH3 and multiple ankyrin repeat domains protein 1 [Aplysia californica]
MEEQRTLSEYPIQGPIGFLEFKYKRRVYKLMQVNERKLKQLHSKAKLKLFLEVVRAGHCDKVNKMTIKGLDPNFHDQDNGETPLTTAVTLGKSKCREVIMTLISGGAHLDFRNRQGLTALHRAAIVGNAEAIRSLLDLGASPNCADGRDLTPLYYSVSNDDAAQECTHLLLHERSRIGVCDEHGWYEIHQACKDGRVQHLEHLLFYGAEMDVRNSCGNTPLHVCALNKQEACARVLLFRGAEPGLLNYSNQTADQAAVVAGNPGIADMILGHNPDDVVPYREIPQYSSRRKGGSLTPSLRALIRSRSDPRVNLSGLAADATSSSTSSPTYGAGHLTRASRHAGIDSDSACSVSVSSTGSVTGVTDLGMYEGRTPGGREGFFPGGHVSQLQVRRAGSLGDVHNVARSTTQRNTLATLVHVDREQVPRVVLLHRSAEGYGFVLRGAKSKAPTGGSFNDFTPTSEYPALQYLDSVDPGSQADRAGLKSGDFILEINGENVIRASHEHVVHLIRSSSDVLTLKVVTVTHTDRMADWTLQADAGAMTLPARRKQAAAPLPPQRDPRTSLSYSKASSRSMAEGLAEIEKLDAALAEFEGQEVARRHSLHGLQTLDDPKVASVRASHTVKRVSVLDYDGLLTGEPTPPAATSSKGNKEYMSPAEARIKKYHKKSASQTMERSKSTPDMLAELQASGGIETGAGTGGKLGGSWSKSRPPPPPPHTGQYTGALHVSPTHSMGQVKAAVSAGHYQRGSASVPTTPELPDRAPVNRQTAPGAPTTPEVVRINTASKSNSTYANVSADVQKRLKNESSYESSFRPGLNAKMIDSPPKAGAPPSDQTILKKTTNRMSPKDDRVSFADDRVMENAQKFIKKHPNATLLVTADIHSDKAPSEQKGAGSPEKAVYEPEPDYEDSDDDGGHKVSTLRKGHVAGTTNAPAQTKAAVTVISISSNDKPKSSGAMVSPALSSTQTGHGVKSATSNGQDQVTLTSPSQSAASSRRSSGVALASLPQSSSVDNSRRSSVHADSSTEAHRSRPGLMVATAMTSSVPKSPEPESEVSTYAPPPPPVAPPPPPPMAPPPPPPLPPPVMPVAGSSDSTLRRQQSAAPVVPNLVSSDDIMAAVAERRARLQAEGPRVSEVKPSLPTNKSVHELNQEALKAAVAKRKSRMERDQDTSVVTDIESRLQKNKKLQAAKFFTADTTGRHSSQTGKEEKPTAVVAAPAQSKAVEENMKKSEPEQSSLKPKEIAAKFDPGKNATPPKVSPVLQTKSVAGKWPAGRDASPSPGPNVTTLDLKSRLKPVELRGGVSPIASHTAPTGAVKSPTVKTKAPAPPPPGGKTSPAPAASSPSVSTHKPSPVLTSKSTSASEPKPEPPESPTLSKTPVSPSQSADYITLAEKARQEYLKKKASGNLTPNVEKKGPVEITPSRKGPPRSPVTSQPRPPTLIDVKPASGSGEAVQVSIKDRIKNLQADKPVAVQGVTEDHSHTEQSLSNGTIRKPKSNGSISPPPSLMAPLPAGHLDDSLPPPPPPGFDDRSAPLPGRGVLIDIVPPPSSFGNAEDPGEPPSSVPAFGQEDAASFVSSVSSLSTLSSEQGEGTGPDKNMSIEDMIAPPPPPPPNFDESQLGDQEAFIPPPPQFLELDSNANVSKSMEKTSKALAGKPVSSWSCMDVLDWLDTLGLPQYRVSFAKACVDGAKLVDMGRNEFISLGVTQVGHRMNLERSVKKLNLAASTNL